MDIVYEKTLYSTLKTVSNKPKTVRRKPPKKGKFEVYKDKASEYRFRLKASNGEIIAVSEGYKSKRSCIHGIQSVKKNVLKPKIVEVQ